MGNTRPWFLQWCIRTAAAGAIVLVLLGSGIAPTAYNTVDLAGGSVLQRTVLNFIQGSNVTLTVVDNPGATPPRTDVTIASSAGGGVGVPNYSQSFVAQTSVTLTDNAGTTAKVIQCFDGSNIEIIPLSITITDANNTAVTFSAAQTGKCIVNSSGNTGGQGLLLGIASKSGAYTFTSSDYAITGDTTAGGFSVKLEAAPATGQVHVLKKIAAANTLTLDGNGKNVDGAATQAITTNNVSLTVQYDGTQWRIE